MKFTLTLPLLVEEIFRTWRNKSDWGRREEKKQLVYNFSVATRQVSLRHSQDYLAYKRYLELSN
jgi:hypothetical protein